MAFEFKMDKDAPLLPTTEEYKSVLQLVERAYIEQITLFQEDLYNKGYGDGYKAAKDEIVHCEECKHGKLDESFTGNCYHCRVGRGNWNYRGHFAAMEKGKTMRLIDADYLVNVIIHNCPIEEGGIPVKDFATHNRILAFYPTIDAVPVVHGQWVHDINNLYGCSECMKRETMSPKKLKPYCPNCGAKMDLEVE